MSVSASTNSSELEPVWVGDLLSKGKVRQEWALTKLRSGRQSRISASTAIQNLPFKDNICDNCRKVNLEYLFFGSPSTGYRADPIEQPVIATLEQIGATAANGCPLCKYILQPSVLAILKRLYPELLEHRNDVEVFVGASDYYESRDLDLDECDHGYSAVRLGVKSGHNGRRLNMECKDKMLQLRDHRASKYRNVPRQANLDICKEWFDECSSAHNQCSLSGMADTKTSNVVNPYFRVIDVATYHIVEIGDNLKERYAALSYVWGNATKIWRLSKKSDLWTHNPEGLPSFPIPPNISGTIYDAIEVTKALGLRYLWVDALCIAQDDSEELKLQIQAMDSVYNSASICIIVACKPEAADGIPGVSVQRPDEPEQNVQIKDGFVIGLQRPRFDQVMKDTKYMDRGWTFQELLLSRRCLMFTEHEIYYFCAGMTMYESTHTKAEENETSMWAGEHIREGRHHIGNSSLIQKLCRSDDHRDPWLTWGAAVCEYSRRELSFQTDGLNAFQGIALFMGKHMQSEMVYGCPRKYLVNALDWRPRIFVPVENPHDTQRRMMNLTEKGAGPLLPSWTWSSYTGIRNVPTVRPMIRDTALLIMSSHMIPPIQSTPELQKSFVITQALGSSPSLTSDGILPLLTKIAILPVSIEDEDYHYIFDIERPRGYTNENIYEVDHGSRCEADDQNWRPKDNKIAFIQLWASLERTSLMSSKVTVMMLQFHDLPLVEQKPGADHMAEVLEENDLVSTARSLTLHSYGPPTKYLQDMPEGCEKLRISTDNYTPLPRPILATRAGVGHIRVETWLHADVQPALVLLG